MKTGATPSGKPVNIPERAHAKGLFSDSDKAE